MKVARMTEGTLMDLPPPVADRDRFGGIGRLYGTDALARLARAHVMVVGVGGVGSWTVEALARSGVGALTLVDMDDVCVTNINRQLPALDGTVGRPKVEVLAERIALINPACRVTPEVAFFTAASADRLLEGTFDYVVDAVDRMSIKALLIARSQARGFRVLTVGAAGGKRDATQVRVDDLGRAGRDELLRQVRKRLRREHGYAKGEGHRYDVAAVFSAEPPVFPQPDGSCAAVRAEGEDSLRMDCAGGYGAAAFVTGAFGFAAAGEVVRQLAEGLR